MVVHACGLSTQETEVGGQFEASLSCITRLCLKETTTMKSMSMEKRQSFKQIVFEQLHTQVQKKPKKPQ
jgi:hypothetical protein